MEIIIMILIIDIIYIGYKYRRGRDLSDVVMCVEKCDFKSCKYCEDKEQCYMSRGENQ